MLTMPMDRNVHGYNIEARIVYRGGYGSEEM